MKLPSAKEMRALEKLTIEKYKVPSLVLMENAGVSTVRNMERDFGCCANSFSPIFIGPGNNGGDGLVIGRHLHQRGCQPVFFLLAPEQQFKADAKTNLDAVLALELPCHDITTTEQVHALPLLLAPFIAKGLRCYAFVDAIFGLGLSREVEGHYREAIEMVNQLAHWHNSPIVAVDIASGLNADTGRIMGVSIGADCTTTFGCAKPGHFLASGKAATGKLEIVDIGIPPRVFSEINIAAEQITPATLQTASHCLRRNPAAHKGENGHLLLIAGSHGKSGAAILTARGALRAGAGLVTIASTPGNNSLLQTTVPEAMTLPLVQSDEFLACHDWSRLKKNIEQYDCIVLGPGLGQHQETAELVLRIFHEISAPAIIDADALNILASWRERLHPPGGTRIYTPHPGELARLLKCSVKEILEDSCAAAMKACRIFTNKKFPALMVVKGPGTIVTDGENRNLINATGNPAMATGGMGDVLSGIIGALLCQGLTPLFAATSGVYLHGLAADICEQAVGTGLYASEVADNIPAARRQLDEATRLIENSIAIPQKKQTTAEEAIGEKR